MQGDAGGAHHPVQARRLQPCGAEVEQVRRQVVAQDGHGLAVGAAQPLQDRDLRALRDAECGGDVGGRGNLLVADDLRGRALPGRLQVVVEAAELQRALHLAVHHLGAHPAPPDQQPLVDERLDGLPDGGPGQAQPHRQVHLVAQEVARGQDPVLDRLLQLLGELVVERHGTAPVQGEGQRVQRGGGHGTCGAAGLRHGGLPAIGRMRGCQVLRGKPRLMPASAGSGQRVVITLPCV